jgi:hypothetical protein
MTRGQLFTLTLAAMGISIAGTLFCIMQIYSTAQLPEGDGTGMQWIILTPLAALFLFIVLPAFLTGLRGLRILRAHQTATPSQAIPGVPDTIERIEALHVLPGKGWLIALGLLTFYLVL